MKKLSLVVALMLAITIGGVYATWNYAGGGLSGTAENHFLDRVTMITDPNTEISKGALTVDVSNLKITIDDPDTDENANTAVLSITGYIEIVFKPTISGMSEIVEQKGIPLTYKLGYNGLVYGSDPIFNVDGSTQSLAEGVGENYESGLWVKTGTGTENLSFTRRIQATELSGLITLSDNFYLKSIEEYSNFRDALHNGSLYINFSEGAYTPTEQQG